MMTGVAGESLDTGDQRKLEKRKLKIRRDIRIFLVIYFELMFLFCVQVSH